jgi:hypothetical protein
MEGSGFGPRASASVNFPRKTKGDEVNKQFSEWTRATLPEEV